MVVIRAQSATAIAIAILGRELGTASPRAIVERVRARLGEAAYAGEAGKEVSSETASETPVGGRVDAFPPK